MGAWIEIKHYLQQLMLKQVAPFMGAWIEIQESTRYVKYDDMSHPLWVRGLKFLRQCCQSPKRLRSHPLWVRGLKFL